jgi:hypothetical protein
MRDRSILPRRAREALAERYALVCRVTRAAYGSVKALPDEERRARKNARNRTRERAQYQANRDETSLKRIHRCARCGVAGHYAKTCSQPKPNNLRGQ